MHKWSKEKRILLFNSIQINATGSKIVLKHKLEVERSQKESPSIRLYFMKSMYSIPIHRWAMLSFLFYKEILFSPKLNEKAMNQSTNVVIQSKFIWKLFCEAKFQFQTIKNVFDYSIAHMDIKRIRTNKYKQFHLSTKY